MANQQIIDYIASLEGKFGQDRIRKVLLDVGWPESEVNEAFQTFESAKTVFEKQSMPQLNWIKIYLVMLFLISIPLVITWNGAPSGKVPLKIVTDLVPEQVIVPNEVEQIVPQIPTQPIALPSSEVNVKQEISEVQVREEVLVPAVPQLIPPVIQLVTPLPPQPQVEIVDCTSLVDDQRDVCLLNDALKAKSEETCNRIRIIEKRNECLTNLAIVLAKRELCQTFANPDSCYNQYALALKDVSACEKIVSTELRENCK